MPRKARLSAALKKKIQEKREELAKFFREAVKAQIVRWDNDREIEKLLNVEVDLHDTIENWASSYDTPESTDDITATDDVIKAITDSIIVELEDEDK